MKFRLTLNITGLILFSGSFMLASCVSEPDGPNPQNYEDYVGARDNEPAFSPDGNFIAYCHFSAQLPEPLDYKSGLYIIDKNGQNRKQVLTGRFFNPAWSPDGQWIVFSNQGLIQKCKTNGEDVVTSQATGSFFPDYDPEGNRIIFDRVGNNPGNGSLSSVDSDLKNSPEVYQPTIMNGRDPEYSPKGQYIVYMNGSTQWSHTEIFIRDIANMLDRRLTENNADDKGPTWSPDGKNIAWSSDVIIKTMNSEGTNQTTLSFGQYPSWSINNIIVFSHANGDYTKEVLYTILPDGSNKTQMTF